jgi:membrane-bound lytic murein transglycosylase F
MGICQFMPRTWDEMSKRIGISASPYNAKANILVAAYYMGRLDGQWTEPRPELERLQLAQASYNAGLGNILAAQKKCNNARLWKDIHPCLGFQETINYVKRIWFYYYDMI